MNLQEIRKWASEIDISKIEEKRRHHGKCYKEMLIDRTLMIESLTLKMDNFYKDIQEHLEQLEKIGISLPGTTVEPKDVILDDHQPRKPSPLLP